VHNCHVLCSKEIIKQKIFYANYAIKPHSQDKRKIYLDENENYRTTVIR